mmetsp:Transcript_14198/g.49378  ORF Transcript_14198/g.49378 Transcript_14198/m.49378 type:complete len:290 (-) Transcript_14198:743-1612(-)
MRSIKLGSSSSMPSRSMSNWSKSTILAKSLTRTCAGVDARRIGESPMSELLPPDGADRSSSRLDCSELSDPSASMPPDRRVDDGNAFAERARRSGPLFARPMSSSSHCRSSLSTSGEVSSDASTLVGPNRFPLCSIAMAFSSSDCISPRSTEPLRPRRVCTPLRPFISFSALDVRSTPPMNVVPCRTICAASFTFSLCSERFCRKSTRAAFSESYADLTAKAMMSIQMPMCSITRKLARSVAYMSLPIDKARSTAPATTPMNATCTCWQSSTGPAIGISSTLGWKRTSK